MSVTPFFSIIVPTYNRPDRLRACLQSLVALEYPRDRYEVIVVDDGGDAPLHHIIESLRDDVDIALLQQANSGPASARNTGAGRAKGDFLAFTDDDCMPEERWLRAFGRRVARPPYPMLGGRTINALPDNAYASASQQLIDYLYSYFNESGNRNSFFTSNNMAVSRAQFFDVGGFAATYPRAAGEDREFCSRWLRHGLAMDHVPTAVVRHAHNLHALTFWRQHFDYGRAAFTFHRNRPDRADHPLTPEPLGFYLNLIRFPYQGKRRWRALRECMLLGISQIANAAGYFWEGRIRSARTGRMSD